jgi:hypothetical protein
LARVVGLHGRASKSTRKYNQNEAAKQEHALHDGHAFLENDFVGQDANPRTQGHDFTFGLLALRFERDNGRLPNLIVECSDFPKLTQDCVI